MALRALVFALVAGGAAAQPSDPNLANPTVVVTAALKGGHTISGLVTHLKGVRSFTHGVVLFPGHPGILKLREEGGQPQFELRGNFLMRSRRHWLDEQTLVVAIDAPSDEWAGFTQQFRATPRYGTDVAALLAEVARRFPVKEWTFVGTSEGSVSAYYAAAANPQLASRLILTASLIDQSRNGPGLTLANWDGWSARLLWVHHFDDPCRYTSYRQARRQAERSRSPLVTVRGGDRGRGEACQALTAHGFVGVERDTVLAMRSWIKTGTVPTDVSR